MKVCDLIKGFSDTTGHKDIQIIGNEECAIDGLNFCDRKTEHNSILSYVTSTKYKATIEKNPNIRVIVADESMKEIYLEAMDLCEGCMIIAKKPEALFYEIHEYLCKRKDFYPQFDFDSKIGESCKIDPSAVIEKGVVIGNNVTIGPLTIIKKGTVIEDRVIIGSSTVIGSEGFQVIRDPDALTMHITHVGGCRLCENVYVGDNTCICNSLFEGETYIGKNAKIDNLIHVAHNCYVGDGAVLTAGTILCGGSVVEQNAWIGVNSSVLNKVIIGNGAKIGIGSVVTRNVPTHTTAYGVPAKAKLVFGGGRQLGVQVLKWICDQDWLEVCGVCPVPKELDSYADTMQEIISKYDLPVFSLDELKGKKFDVGLSVNYHKIIPEQVLDTCQKGFYNIHHSYNLRIRGRNISTHAILNSRKDKSFFHGTTLHKMVKELDAGPIVASCSCDIEMNDTAYSLYDKVDKIAFRMLKEWLPRIVFQNCVLYAPPLEGVHIYKNSDLPSREICLDKMNSDSIWDFVRAFDYPGFEPAYLLKKQKIHLVIYPRDEYQNELVLKGISFYSDYEGEI